MATRKYERTDHVTTNAERVARHRAKTLAEGSTRRTIVFDPEASRKLDALAEKWECSATAALHRLLDRAKI
jgi:hypothetical protein